MSRDELHMAAGDSSSGGGASPLTARSLRLERVAQALAHSQEELRRSVSFLVNIIGQGNLIMYAVNAVVFGYTVYYQ